MRASFTRSGSVNASSLSMSVVGLPRTPATTPSHTALARTTSSSGIFPKKMRLRRV